MFIFNQIIHNEPKDKKEIYVNESKGIINKSTLQGLVACTRFFKKVVKIHLHFSWLKNVPKKNNRELELSQGLIFETIYWKKCED